MTRPNKWPAHELVQRLPGDLDPYVNNPRTHTSAQVELLAESIEKWGWTTPILIDERDEIIAGHGRAMAAVKLGLDSVPCVVARGWSEEEKRAYVIADNQLTLAGGWDVDTLKFELDELNAAGFDLDLVGFNEKELSALLKKERRHEGIEGADEFDEVEDVVVTRPGDLWRLGSHRVLCGDSTDADHVAEVMAGELADLIHADPPYGMGKEADGIANDNLYDGKLDAFQVQWVEQALDWSRENAGLYIWGNPLDLWRLWFSELSARDLTFRNEIVWAKGSGFGMASAEMHGYAPETERCMFLMRGPQFLGNVNKGDFWEGFEPMRLWLCEQRDAVGWKAKDINAITSSNMAGHWFTRSQFYTINRSNYDLLRAAALGMAFEPTYDELMGMFSEAQDYRAQRSFFDNAHDTMTDVWRFGRVHGDERFGHATPKPAAMIARAILSSCPHEGLVYEPFLGTGTTLIAAEVTGRRCFGVELEPAYVDVVVRRWQDKTGHAAVLERVGHTFDVVARKREAE